MQPPGVNFGQTVNAWLKVAEQNDRRKSRAWPVKSHRECHGVMAFKVPPTPRAALATSRLSLSPSPLPLPSGTSCSKGRHQILLSSSHISLPENPVEPSKALPHVQRNPPPDPRNGATQAFSDRGAKWTGGKPPQVLGQHFRSNGAARRTWSSATSVRSESSTIPPQPKILTNAKNLNLKPWSAMRMTSLPSSRASVLLLLPLPQTPS